MNNRDRLRAAGLALLLLAAASALAWILQRFDAPLVVRSPE